MGRAIEDVLFLLFFIVALAWLLMIIPATKEMGRRYKLKKARRTKERLLQLEHENEAFREELLREIEEINQQLRKGRNE